MPFKTVKTNEKLSVAYLLSIVYCFYLSSCLLRRFLSIKRIGLSLHPENRISALLNAMKKKY